MLGQTVWSVTLVDFTALGHSSAKMGPFSKLVDRGHLVATDGTTRGRARTYMNTGSHNMHIHIYNLIQMLLY